MAKKKGGGFLEVVRTVVIAVLIAIAIRSFAYEPFNIPSGSMKPTLLIGDYLFVSKWSYGYSRYSLPFGFPLFSGRIFFSPPERGDVAVFKKPSEPKVDYIKRLVGLPGDHIQVRGGILYINGQAVQRQKIEDYVDDNGERLNQYIETLPNGVQHRILERSDDGPYDNTPDYLVPPDHYFAMGDNRDNSADSRADVGFVPAENLVGKAEFLFFSIGEGAEFWEIWKWPEAIRWDRLFHTAQK
jgi:signal peptidase I